MRLAVSEAFKTYICIRKMIIGKVHHLLRFLTISLSYGRPSAFCLLVSGGFRRVWVLSAQRHEAFFFSFSSHQWGVIVFKSMSPFMFGVKSSGDEIATQWNNQEEKYRSMSIWLPPNLCTLPLAGQGEVETSRIKLNAKVFQSEFSHMLRL